MSGFDRSVAALRRAPAVRRPRLACCQKLAFRAWSWPQRRGRP